MALTSNGNRLPPRPGEAIDRSRAVAFTYNGRAIRAFAGDTVASALYASGVTILSRSFKYHRPRGLLCAAGRCPNCLVTVDGVPNVRACTTPVREGMAVRSQNAWPSVDTDALNVIDKFDFAMPVGFYYKTFHQPKLMWHIAQPIIRRLGGLGAVDITADPESHYHHDNRHADVAVAGGGPAGLSAAIAAAGAGAKVVLVDDQPSLGGHLRFDPSRHADVPGLKAGTGPELAAQLAEAVRASSRIQVIAGTVFGVYQDNLVAVLTRDSVIKLRAKRLIVATGSNEVPHVFENNDLPGVMLSTAAVRLAYLYGVKPGRKAVVACGDDYGYRAALALQGAGVKIAAVVDARGGFPASMSEAQALRDSGVRVLNGYVVIRAEGPKHLSAVSLCHLREGVPLTEELRLDCDLLATSGAFEPAAGLLHQSGARFAFDEALGEMLPSDLPRGVLVTGEVTGIRDLRANILQGRVAGLDAASSFHVLSYEARQDLARLRRDLAEALAAYRAHTTRSSPIADMPGKKRFVCFCEDVTVKDVAQAVDEGFADIQSLKRYSTVTMGPCQGKMCHRSFAHICAAKTGQSVQQTGSTTLRPPLAPVPLGALAGHLHTPIKRTPVDKRSRDMGARMTDLGPWRRAHIFSNPEEEALAIRQRVGIIDVTSLGKLDVRGKDCGALLDKIYTNKMSDLQPGRIRYGLMCADSGTILDDGTVSRLAPDHFFVTTTTGNVEAIEEWVRWWTAGTNMCAHVNNVTAAYAAINLAGPKARDTLRKLTDMDISADGFKYMRFGQGHVAGVPAILLRIGFVGETGWEIHFPAEYGEHVWDALLNAGEEFGIIPCGLEAQRILRLEKKHIIVNQDTDSVTTPLEADMEWAVKFDKEDFVGRGGIRAVKERGIRNKVVGFVMRDGLVPDDGDPVVMGGSPIGRVTSSRFSPALRKGIGIAYVPADYAEEGRELLISINGRTEPATVTLKPFYDPEGERLRA